MKNKIPRTPTKLNEKEQLRLEVKHLRMTLATISFRILFSRDILDGAGAEVAKRGRMTQEIAANLRLQIAVLENVLNNVLGLPKEAVDKYREKYVKDEFDKAIRQVADELAPLIITPEKKVQKFTLEN